MSRANKRDVNLKLASTVPLGKLQDSSGGGADERIKSGVPRLDYILNGGFLKQNVYSIFGPPGSGKTIFANQFSFNHILLARGSCVYLTLLTESHAKVIKHLKGLSFFDPSVIGHKLNYLSGYQTLKNEGLTGLLKLLQLVVNDRKPSILIVDGFESTDAFAASKFSRKEFLHELQTFNSIALCTTFLFSTTHGDEAKSSENTLVDGVIQMSDKVVGPRAVRELTVLKFRGSDYLRGRHELEITSDGIQIHPRTEVQFNQPVEIATENRVRMKFGISSLDKMLLGGIPSGSTTALLGAPGAGKTTLGLSFLIEGAHQKQKGIYFGFYEPPPRLIEKAEALGLPLQKHVKSGMIELIWQPPLEHFMDALAEQLLEKIRADNRARCRLFIDGVEGFRAASVYPDRIPRFLSAFTNQLRMSDVTSLISEELPLFRSEVDMPNPELANVVESIILVRYVELHSQLHRLLSILKMRESRYDTSIREFKIASTGIKVAKSFKSAESILSGHAKLRERGK